MSFILRFQSSNPLYEDGVESALVDDAIKRFRFKVHASYIHLDILKNNSVDFI